MLSVLWRHICRHNSDINNDMHVDTRYVILAKHWMWLPDDGSTWTETCWSSFYHFNYFNNLTIYNFVCISWTIKCLMLLMYGATMKFTDTCYFVSYSLYRGTHFGSDWTIVRVTKLSREVKHPETWMLVLEKLPNISDVLKQRQHELRLFRIKNNNIYSITYSTHHVKRHQWNFRQNTTKNRRIKIAPKYVRTILGHLSKFRTSLLRL